jgi:hypothetical protein
MHTTLIVGGHPGNQRHALHLVDMACVVYHTGRNSALAHTIRYSGADLCVAGDSRY